jgi:hypothetical protein
MQEKREESLDIMVKCLSESMKAAAKSENTDYVVRLGGRRAECPILAKFT